MTLRCPVLAVKCKWACPVPLKGSWTWAATVVLKNLELLGYWKVFLKSDHEKSSKALAQAVKNARSREIILESNLVADSQGNGKGERAVGNRYRRDSGPAVPMSRVAHRTCWKAPELVSQRSTTRCIHTVRTLEWQKLENRISSIWRSGEVSAHDRLQTRMQVVAGSIAGNHHGVDGTDRGNC